MLSTRCNVAVRFVHASAQTQHQHSRRRNSQPDIDICPRQAPAITGPSRYQGSTLRLLQRTEEKRLQWLEQQLASLGQEESSQGVPRLTPGSLCAAQFSLDDKWYRARVAHVKGARISSGMWLHAGCT